jgi:uracil-DNA glycosylase family 4
LAAGSLRQATSQRLARLAEEIVSCTRCPRLVIYRQAVASDPPARFRGQAYWARPVPGFGDPEASILIVGLAPAAHGANRTGRMFTGDRSGHFLFQALNKAGLANQGTSTSPDDGLRLRDVYVTAAVKCAPPQNKPTREEISACSGFLAEEFEILSPTVRVVLALGEVAFRACCRLLGARPYPPFRHGALHATPRGPHLLASYHPSQQNTFTGRLKPEMLTEVLEQAKLLVGRQLRRSG